MSECGLKYFTFLMLARLHPSYRIITHKIEFEKQKKISGNRMLGEKYEIVKIDEKVLCKVLIIKTTNVNLI